MCVCPSEEFCGDERPKSLISQKPKPESPRLTCWLQKLDHTLHTARRSFNQPCLSLWVLVYATEGRMAFRFNTVQFCTEVVLKTLQMTGAHCRGVKTCQLAVFLKRQTTEWWSSIAWGGHMWEKRRTGMKVGRRDGKLKVRRLLLASLFLFSVSNSV